MFKWLHKEKKPINRLNFFLWLCLTLDGIILLLAIANNIWHLGIFPYDDLNRHGESVCEEKN